jgi:signal transduction histidine kinase
MGNLIDDLLTFSRVGRAEIQKANINLDALVRETLGDFQAETNARTIRVENPPAAARARRPRAAAIGAGQFDFQRGEIHQPARRGEN